eukprot:Lithocolla_globosa_v1_NODE_115_length_6172_cov_14.462155.p11 type:complete len:100 gc:universal NODE_115_length_6172_cov_14.462155:4741-5040(+)
MHAEAMVTHWRGSTPAPESLTKFSLKQSMPSRRRETSDEQYQFVLKVVHFIGLRGMPGQELSATLCTHTPRFIVFNSRVGTNIVLVLDRVELVRKNGES